MFDHRDDALVRIIGSIGRGGFEEATSKALCSLIGFDAGAVILHQSGHHSSILYDDFDQIDGRDGLQNYVRHTYRINPILRVGPQTHIFRACDFRNQLFVPHSPPRRSPAAPPGPMAYVLMSEDEELGYRTIGWPANLEEVGILIPSSIGLLELGFYRQRTSRPVTRRSLQALEQLRAPTAAAFDRHCMLSGTLSSKTRFERASLTEREREVVRMVVSGCSSHAIALRLGISLHTVKDHRKNIFRKLGISSSAELFAIAHEPHGYFLNNIR